LIKYLTDLLNKLKDLPKGWGGLRTFLKYIFFLLGLILVILMTFMALEEIDDDDNELVATIQKGPPPQASHLNKLKAQQTPTVVEVKETPADLSHIPPTPSFDGRVARPISIDPSVQDTRYLPCIGKGGEKPCDIYKHVPNPSNSQPEHPFSLVISGLGDDPALLNQVLESIPQTVALAFLTDSPGLLEGHTNARNKGYETLLMIPLEGMGYPLEDAGPGTLLTGEGQGAWDTALNKSLSQVTGYLGSRFTRIERSQRWLLNSLNHMGLIYAESFQGIPSSTASVSRELKTPYINLSPAIRGEFSLKQTLNTIEADALKNPLTVGHITLTHASQLPIVQDWLSSLSAKKMGPVPLTQTWKRIQEKNIQSTSPKAQKSVNSHAKPKP
jgi:uncharacterized protein